MTTFTANEYNTLIKYLNNTNNYLEFGCGQSTIAAAKLNNIKNIISFDSSIDWINNVFKELDPQSITKCNLFHLDIGPVKEWGYPINIDNNVALNYSFKFIQYLPINLLYDFIFIDGRYRVATFLLSSLYLEKCGFIAIHDYINRPWYFIINDFFNLIEVQDSLCIFQKRQDIDLSSLIRIYSHYISDGR